MAESEMGGRPVGEPGPDSTAGSGAVDGTTDGGGDEAPRGSSGASGEGGEGSTGQTSGGGEGAGGRAGDWNPTGGGGEGGEVY